MLKTLRDAADPGVLAELRQIDRELKRLLTKDDLCECDCPECVAGDCIDCSNPDCEDPNCDANKSKAKAAMVRELQQFAVELKRIV
jgi:hypothetical protein